MKSRRVAVLGGGNGARTMAADLTLAGHRVSLFEMEEFHNEVAAIFENQIIHIKGKAREGVAQIALTTHRLEEAIQDSEMIFLVLPAFAHRIYAEKLAAILQDNQHIVLVPGTFGSFEFYEEITNRGCTAKITISELDTLPYATRIDGPASVHVYHSLPSFGIGVFPAQRTEEVMTVISDLYEGAIAFRDTLEAGLSNVNPVIHPLGVLMNAGRIEYSRGEFWYYEEGITPSTARAMTVLDQERINLGRKIGLELMETADALHLFGYGPKGDLWEVLKGSKGLTPIKGPVTLSGRYITEDLPIGLVCWSELGCMVDAPTPLMRAAVEIGISISGTNYWETGRTMERCGIAGMSIDQLLNFVQTGERR